MYYTQSSIDIYWNNDVDHDYDDNSNSNNDNDDDTNSNNITYNNYLFSPKYRLVHILHTWKPYNDIVYNCNSWDGSQRNICL